MTAGPARGAPGPFRTTPGPFRITARAALARGARELIAAPAPTLLAVTGSLVGAVAARAAVVRAAQALAAERPGRAAAIWLVGMSLAALLVDVTRAAALVAYSGPRRSFAATLALGLLRTPGMISVRAVELTIYFALGLGELFLFARLPIAPGPAALALYPAVALALAVFVGSRVAQLVVARGLPPAVALVHGYDFVLRRLPSLTRLGLWGALVTAPFWITAALSPAPLSAALMAVAALWLLAALVVELGADPFLAIG